MTLERCRPPAQAALTYGCQVDTLTLSTKQKALAEERIKDAGLENHVRVHLLDYRKIPAEFEKVFDAFVSIEMIEVCSSMLLAVFFARSHRSRSSTSAPSTTTLISN